MPPSPITQQGPVLLEPTARAPTATVPPADDLAGGYMKARDQSGSAADRLLQQFSAEGKLVIDIPGQGAPGASQRGTESVSEPGAGDTGAADVATGTLETAAAVASDVGLGLVEAPGAVFGGLVDAATEFTETVMQISDPVAQFLESTLPLGEAPGPRELFAPITPDDPESVTGGLVRGVTTFVAGFLPALKATRALSGGKAITTAGQFAQFSAAGSLADVAVIDEQEENLANLVQEFPALANPVTEFLAASPGDGVAFAKFKLAVEGLGIGVAADGLVQAVRFLGRARAVRAGEKPTEPVPAKAAHEAEARDFTLLGDPSKPLVSPATADEAEGMLRLAGPDQDAININLSRIETPDDVKEIITKTARAFGGEIDEARRGVQTNEATARLADDLGMTPEELLTRREGQAFNAEEALAARRLLVASGENLVALAKRASDTAASEQDLFAFRKALGLHAGLQQQVSGLTAEAGRALQAFRIPASGAAKQDRLIREALDSAGGADFSRNMAQKLAALDDPSKINEVARRGFAARTSDVFFEVWINALLSGPQTHAVNMLSNTITSLWQIPERALAAGISRVTGSGSIAGGEAVAQAFGFVQGARDGFVAAAKAFRSGESADPAGKIEVKRQRAISGEALELSGMAGRAADYLGEAVRFPGRLLITSDEFFKAIGYRMELNAQALRTAKAEGLEGEQMAARIREIITHPPDNIDLAAIDAARYQTFTNELGPAGKAAQKTVQSIPALRLIMPFIRTPTNIMKFTVERSPAAPLLKSFREDVRAGGSRRDLALARLSMGSTIMAISADLTMAGVITGGGPSDPRLKATLRRTGWQPYSIKIGDTYHAFSRLDPIGATLGLAADTAEIMGGLNGRDQDHLAAALVGAVAKNVVNKTYMRGVSEFMEVVNDPDRHGERFLRQFAGTLIPTGVAQAERIVDPTLRDAQSVFDQICSRTPGCSDSLPPRRNLWGEPIRLSGGLGPDIVSPIYTSETVDSAIDNEILRLQVPVSMPARQIEGIELTPEEYSRYVELTGNELKDPGTGLGLKETLDAIVTGNHDLSAEYSAATDGPDGGKSFTIRKIIQAFKTLARQQVLEEFGDLRRAADQRRLEGALELGVQ